MTNRYANRAPKEGVYRKLAARRGNNFARGSGLDGQVVEDYRRKLNSYQMLPDHTRGGYKMPKKDPISRRHESRLRRNGAGASTTSSKRYGSDYFMRKMVKTSRQKRVIRDFFTGSSNYSSFMGNSPARVSSSFGGAPMTEIRIV